MNEGVYVMGFLAVYLCLLTGISMTFIIVTLRMPDVDSTRGNIYFAIYIICVISLMLVFAQFL